MEYDNDVYTTDTQCMYRKFRIKSYTIRACNMCVMGIYKINEW